MSFSAIRNCVFAVLMTAVSATGATNIWTGLVNNLWSVGGNWNSGVPPAAGDALTFPSGAANTNMTNDLPTGLALQSLAFNSNTSYSLSGNGIALSGGLSALAPSTTLSAPITLNSSQTFLAASPVNFAGPLDLNSFTLTLNSYNVTISGSLIGSGTLIINPLSR